MTFVATSRVKKGEILHAATTNAWIWCTMLTIVEHAKTSVCRLKLAATGDALIFRLIRGTVDFETKSACRVDIVYTASAIMLNTQLSLSLSLYLHLFGNITAPLIVAIRFVIC